MREPRVGTAAPFATQVPADAGHEFVTFGFVEYPIAEDRDGAYVDLGRHGTGDHRHWIAEAIRLRQFSVFTDSRGHSRLAWLLRRRLDQRTHYHGTEKGRRKYGGRRMNASNRRLYTQTDRYAARVLAAEGAFASDVLTHKELRRS